jgi:hypothetical protein
MLMFWHVHTRAGSIPFAGVVMLARVFQNLAEPGFNAWWKEKSLS